MTPEGDSLQVTEGSRVQCDNSFGTVKYLGEVATTQGLWVGVEWDDNSRGKHNGSFGGVQYFHARYPMSGSFVRPNKLEVGVSCVDAIKERYGEVKNDETGGIDKEILAKCKQKLNARFMEVVGFDKVNKQQSQFEELRVVGLRDYKVVNSGPPKELENLCPKVQNLNLSRNLLNCWHRVAEITLQLKQLQLLNISENRLTIPENPASLQSAFQSVTHLILGLMDYSWCDIMNCSYMLPALNELQVPFNRISSLQSPPPDILSKLVHLDLEGNNIVEWSELNKLGYLPMLQSLNLANIGIRSISFPEGSCPGKTDLFPILEKINLSGNVINSWASVCELDKLKKLKDMRFRDNPLVAGDDVETCRQLTIVSVDGLLMLDGVFVTRDERKGAEYDYLKDLGKQWLDIKKENNETKINEFLTLYPRYMALVKKYGMPEEGELKTVPANLKSTVISVEIFNPDGKGEPRIKKLPNTLMVQKLIGFVQRLFDTGSEIPKLSYISSKNPDAEFPLDNELKELNFYSVEDGDRICVRW